MILFTRNQRRFELQERILYHEKAPEKCCSMMIFSKTLTENLAFKKSKKHETIH